MSKPDQDLPQNEMQRMRDALEAETRRCLEAQRLLDAAVAEFEEFISKAAHNLRESLRGVASSSELIAESNAGRLDRETGVLLERVREGTARIESLLADVVDYWAMLAGERQPSPTDMEAVLRQALLSGGRQIGERGAVVTHDPLPLVRGDFDALAKVLGHLIRNAIQYCDGPARVHLSSRREDREWVFSVQDNGPGIAPAFQERIFGAFQRLHGSESPGNGLGLPFCRKAIERYGGRLWMESAPAAGSTFYFTLPPAD